MILFLDDSKLMALSLEFQDNSSAFIGHYVSYCRKHMIKKSGNIWSKQSKLKLFLDELKKKEQAN